MDELNGALEPSHDSPRNSQRPGRSPDPRRASDRLCPRPPAAGPHGQPAGRGSLCGSAALPAGFGPQRIGKLGDCLPLRGVATAPRRPSAPETEEGAPVFRPMGWLCSRFRPHPAPARGSITAPGSRPIRPPIGPVAVPSSRPGPFPSTPAGPACREAHAPGPPNRQRGEGSLVGHWNRFLWVASPGWSEFSGSKRLQPAHSESHSGGPAGGVGRPSDVTPGSTALGGLRGVNPLGAVVARALANGGGLGGRPGSQPRTPRPPAESELSRQFRNELAAAGGGSAGQGQGRAGDLRECEGWRVGGERARFERQQVGLRIRRTGAGGWSSGTGNAGHGLDPPRSRTLDDGPGPGHHPGL